MCRGNWSKDESILLEGPYTPLIKLFEDIDTDALFLEFSTKRAGELKSLFASDKIRKNYILGLGVINPRTDEIESHEDMVARAEEALGYIDKERLFLNPDCGFATFANRPVSTLEIIDKKLAELEKAVKELKEKYE